MCDQWVAKDTSFLYADSEDSDQTGRNAQADLSLCWPHSLFVGFVTRRLKSYQFLFSNVYGIIKRTQEKGVYMVNIIFGMFVHITLSYGFLQKPDSYGIGQNYTARNVIVILDLSFVGLKTC